MRRIASSSLSLLLIALSIVVIQPWQSADAQSHTPGSSQPNVIFILLDDLDYQDLAAYGATDTITPNIDSIANEGMILTQYYANGAVCTPTRAALLTSQFPSTFGFNTACNFADPYVPSGKWQGDNRGISADFLTVGELFQSSGYTTGHFGKWHVGLAREEFRAPAKGFDVSVRARGGYKNFTLNFNEEPPISYNAGQYRPQVITDEILAFIDTAHNSQTPFYTNAWYFSPHKPLHIPTGFDNGCCGFDLTSPRGKLAAMLYSVDVEIGRILTHLDTLGIRDDTLIVLASDNGGWVDPTDRPERILRGFKGDLFEGGVRVPMMFRWPTVIPAGTSNPSLASGLDFLPTMAELVAFDTTQYPLQGSSLVEVISQNVVRPPAYDLFWEIKEPTYITTTVPTLSFAVRSDNWKLVQDGRIQPEPMLFDLDTDLGETTDLATQYPTVVADMLADYHEWRRTAGDVAVRDMVFSATGVSVANMGSRPYLDFDDGLVTLGNDTRFDLHVGEFSFIADILVETFPTTENAVIASRDGSWTVAVTPQQTLVVELTGIDIDGNVQSMQLESPPVSADTFYQLAWTVDGFQRDYMMLKLYLDQLLVDEIGHSDSILVVGYSNDETITLGNSADQTVPGFVGMISIPRLSVMTLTPPDLPVEQASPAVTMIVTPTGPTTLSTCGGVITLDITFTNNSGINQTSDYWATIFVPDGRIRTGIATQPMTLGVNESITVAYSQAVPSRAPAGDYNYDVFFGEDPVWTAYDGFVFTKQAGSCAAPFAGTDWVESE